ncbi:MAG: glutathione S-transferase [Alphaproteobacteria bacterium]|nr:glutathione S-transferase [Alphaproteobacteria bacterium]
MQGAGPVSGYHLVIGDKRHSSWSLRPWLLLTEFGLPFRETEVALDRDTTAAAIRRHSPSGRVPVLYDGGFAVWDSLAILEYLAEQHPEHRVWPAPPLARARARSLAAEMHAGFASLRAELPFIAGERRPGLSFSAEAAAEVARLKAIVADSRGRFGGAGGFLFGPFGAVDAMFAPVMCRFASYGIPVDGPVEAYMRGVLELPGLQAWNRAAAAGAAT